jgi:glycosyltransferase involved in cell wall biosynthesis
MTAYNRDKYISEAIESVMASTYINFELIIVDDCSTDNTLAIAKSYEEADNRIRVYKNEKNLKDYPNRNRAASYAEGKYIKFLDSDDTIFKWGLAYCIEMMENYASAGMGFLYLGETGINEYLTSKEALEEHFFKEQLLTIGPSGAVYRRDAFESIGGFKPDFGAASDMYFNLKMATYFPVVLLKKVFFFYRTHDAQEINNTYSYLFYNYKYANEALNNFPFDMESKAINLLIKKNKRRFVINVTKYFFTSLNLKKTITAIKNAGFSLKDFFEGIFH